MNNEINLNDLTLEEVLAAAATLRKLIAHENGDRIMGIGFFCSDAGAVAVAKDTALMLERTAECAPAMQTWNIPTRAELRVRFDNAVEAELAGLGE